MAELLEKLKIEEEDRVKSFIDLEHPGMIGSMYEGLTKRLLDASLPDNLDLRYVSGKITNDDGELSGQIDLMLVNGEGISIPFTNLFVYNIRNVIAIIEVKKNIFSREIGDSHRLFMSVRKLFQPSGIKTIPILSAFKTITKIGLEKHEDHKRHSIEMQNIYHSLVVMHGLPVRITLGYNGVSSELGLRKAFVKYLENHPSKHSFGPASLPDLMVCGSNSIVKLNGMPYSFALMLENRWMVFASYARNPILLLLELVYTRVTNTLDVSSEIFGEDLEEERLNPLLDCRYFENEKAKGWDYRIFDFEKEYLEKSRNDSIRSWNPQEVSSMEYTILKIAGAKESVDPNDPGIIELLQSENVVLSELVESLVSKNLAFQDVDGKIKLLTDSCVVVTMPDGKHYAADNSSGRLDRWVQKYINTHR